MRVLTFTLAALVGLSLAANAPLLQQQCSWGASLAARLRGGSCEVAPAEEPSLFGRVQTWHPVLLALLGTTFGWFMTALGAAGVVIHQLGLAEKEYRKVLDFMLGISGGVMTAASYWSLLAPALEFAEAQGWAELSYVPVALGFLSGGVLLQWTDTWLSRMQGSGVEEFDLYKGLAVSKKGVKVSKKDRVAQFRKMLLLIIAITIHNFPEGMAVGVAFGAIGVSPGATLGGAITLALGIGIQNFPEGLAVSMPLMREGVPPLKAFWYGQLSGLVEPVGGVLGAAFVQYCRPMLPYTMSLAAGAMIFVVCDSMVPEMQAHGNKALAMQGLMLGFVLMMCLDVALG
jgi:ZIP family zinc transporter